MSKFRNILGIICFAALGFTACGGGEAHKTEGAQQASAQPAADAKPAADEGAIRMFLKDPEGYYGWQTTADKISFDFFDDGRLHIQGPDGEATMWEGKWELKGDQLTLQRADLNKTETVTVKIDGDKLVLGDKTYTRYKP